MKKKSGSKSNKKGSAFNRRMAKVLSKWWTRGRRDDIFWRSDTSGARATERRKKGLETKNSSGDIGLLDPIGQPLLDVFCIELKDGYSKGKDIVSSFFGIKPIIIKWWEKLIAEKGKTQDGLLIYSPYGTKQSVIIFSVDVFHRFVGLSTGVQIPFNIIYINTFGHQLVMLNTNTFLLWITPEDIDEYIGITTIKKKWKRKVELC